MVNKIKSFRDSSTFLGFIYIYIHIYIYIGIIKILIIQFMEEINFEICKTNVKRINEIIYLCFFILYLVRHYLEDDGRFGWMSSARSFLQLFGKYNRNAFRNKTTALL